MFLFFESQQFLHHSVLVRLRVRFCLRYTVSILSFFSSPVSSSREKHQVDIISIYGRRKKVELTIIVARLHLKFESGILEVLNVLPQHTPQTLDVLDGAPQRLHLAALVLQGWHVLLQETESIIHPFHPIPFPRIASRHLQQYGVLNAFVLFCFVLF